MEKSRHGMGGKSKQLGTAKPNKSPAASSKAALNRMKAAKPRDTAPEIALRTILQEMGLTFCVDVSPIEDLRRRVDILFVEERVAVMIDGCYWHGCPQHGTWPKQNAEFWKAKIEANKRRDSDTNQRLEKAGWHVVRVWEHEAQKDAARRILDILNPIIRNSNLP
jgi:DNA mismatch endonuclease (patch repair protein)